MVSLEIKVKELENELEQERAAHAKTASELKISKEIEKVAISAETTSNFYM